MTDIADMGWQGMKILRMCCGNLFNLALVLTGPCQLLLSVAARAARGSLTAVTLSRWSCRCHCRCVVCKA